ncbi:MAG: hypothetical protein HQ582_18800, partial [Planctomycetes bacterium]|nr:hypothetical protein [Planctomycetota bacterium]
MSEPGRGLRGGSVCDPFDAAAARLTWMKSVGPFDRSQRLVMAAMNSTSRCVVRCETSWTARAVLCTIALVATGAMAYRMGINRTTSAARYMATATIHHGLHPSGGHNANPSIEPEPLSAAEVKRRIVSRESLHRVLGRMGMAGPDAARSDLSGSGGGIVDRIGERVSVTATETLLPPGLRISVACTDEDPDRVVRLANALAEDYRDQYRTRREIQFGRKCDEALAEAERARKRFLKAQGRFDDFVGQHFHKQEALAERLPKLVDPLPSVDPVNMREPGKTGDLERAELERELAELEERRRELLLTRTSAHPAVSVMEVQIGGLQERMASMPMETPSGEELSWPHEKEPLRSEVADPDYAATAQEFRARKETLDQARQEYDQASALQRGARERRSHDAKIEV